MASVREIAKRANVAPGTVSRVINDKGYISEETREKVRRALEEMEYTPNELARSLSLSRSLCIGILVTDISHPFFSRLAKYLIRELDRRGYRAVLCSTEDGPGQEKKYWEMLRNSFLDGMIASIPTLPDAFYGEMSKPFVMLDRRIADNVPVVCSDYAMSGRMAAENMLRSGCRCAMQFRGDPGVPGLAHERHRVFAEVMRAGGAQVIDIEMTSEILSYREQSQLAETSLKQHPQADGVFAMDILAAAFIRLAQARKDAALGRFRIVGTDGTLELYGSGLEMSAIVQPLRRIAREAVEVLLDLIEGKKVEDRMRLLPVTFRRGDTLFADE